MRPELHRLSISEAGRAFRSGGLRSEDLVRHFLDRIRRLDPALDVFITLAADRAVADAQAADRAFAAGEDRGPLQGIPYGLKDIIDTRGIRTTCNSWLRADHVPDKDATVVTRLSEGGAVLLGKVGTHEFALGGPGFDLPHPPTRNPWRAACFPGGSSSGSGALVAAGFARFAIGSDTGGSIRSPACLCGVVGLKPTYGLVSRHGVFPLSYSLDHVGPVARTVEDAALVLNVIAGHDPSDPASAERPVPNFAADLGKGVDGLRIGYVRSYFAGQPGVSAEVVSALDAAAGRLEALGAIVEEVEAPDFDLFKACGRIIMTAEAYAIHEADLKARPSRFGRYMYQRVAPAALLSAATLIQADRIRSELSRALNGGALSRCDLLLTATALRDAVELDSFPRDWPPPSEAVAVQTVPFNVSGNPALSLPAGFSASGLPLGLQLVGRYFEEAKLLRAAAALERDLQLADLWPDEAAPAESPAEAVG